MITFGLGQIVSSHLMQKLSSIACYRAVEVKMVLSLTRSLASTQLRRTFTHQTWVSGSTTFFFQLSSLISTAKTSTTEIKFLQGHQELGLLLPKRWHMDSLFQLVSWQVGFSCIDVELWFEKFWLCCSGPMWILAHIKDYKSRDWKSTVISWLVHIRLWN